ncbi:MAG: helix-turn-helix domain-containing protein [Clostridiales bacterium]|nr:helix-turn-helix domain-containing protein [Clostridiales bacterium]
MISENIVTLRKKYNFSQEEVAEKIGVTRQTIAKWENGESVPDVIHSNALAELFDITLDTLVNYENGKDGIDEVPPKGKYIFGTVTIGDKGQIVIPVKARRIFDIKPGDSLVVLGDEERGLALMGTDFFIEGFGKIQESEGKKK